MARSDDPNKRADSEEVRALIHESIWAELGAADASGKS
jgi:hypothetical protein